MFQRHITEMDRSLGQAFDSPIVESMRYLFGYRLKFLAEHRGVWDAVFAPSLNERPPDRQIRGVPPALERKLRIMYLLRGVMGKPEWFAEEMKEATEELLEHVARNNDKAEAVPLPEVTLGDLSPDEFRHRFIESPHPVVINGYESDAFRWSADWLIEHYGDVPQLFTNFKKHSSHEGVLRDIRDNEDWYLQNATTLFNHDPDLVSQLHLEHARELSGLTYGHMQQLFLNLRPGPGAPFHCAHNDNFFFMINGVKRWTFVDPAYSFLVGPFHSMRKGVAAGTPKGWDDDADAKAYPLYAYCPRFRVSLQPGQVLYNPQWWWHSIRNETDVTLAVSSRWLHPKAPRRNPNVLFSTVDMVSPSHALSRLRWIYRMANGESPNYMIGKWPMWEHFSQPGRKIR